MSDEPAVLRVDKDEFIPFNSDPVVDFFELVQKYSALKEMSHKAFRFGQHVYRFLSGLYLGSVEAEVLIKNVILVLFLLLRRRLNFPPQSGRYQPFEIEVVLLFSGHF